LQLVAHEIDTVRFDLHTRRQRHRRRVVDGAPRGRVWPRHFTAIRL